MTSVNQGLLSTTMEAEKRDPGNEVAVNHRPFLSDFFLRGGAVCTQASDK